MGLERAPELLEVPMVANAGVNQQRRRVFINEEIRVIARTGHRAWVVRVKPDWIQHEITVLPKNCSESTTSGVSFVDTDRESRPPGHE